MHFPLPRGAQRRGAYVQEIRDSRTARDCRDCRGVGCTCCARARCQDNSQQCVQSDGRRQSENRPIFWDRYRIRLRTGGNALAAGVQDTLLGINQTLPAATPPTCTQGVCSSQSGIGSTGNSNQVLSVAIPPSGGSVLKANLLSASSTSTVDSTTNKATDTGVAESAGVNLVGGLVTADVVRAVASAQASAFNSSFSSAGSSFNNLVVNGTQVNNVNPNTTINLPATLFGPGSFVKLDEEIGSSSQPPSGQLSGGTFAADLIVNMIRVHITNLAPTGDAIDVVVSHAQAHADFPQPAGCPSLVGTVSGNATIVNEQTDPSQLPVVVGYVSIPPQGGHDHQDLDQLSTSLVSGGTSVNDSTGTVLGSS